jgi:hypothetical protein
MVLASPSPPEWTMEASGDQACRPTDPGNCFSLLNPEP